MQKISLLHLRDTIRVITIIFFLPWWAFIIEKIFNKNLTFTNAILVIIMFVVFGGFWCGWLCPFGNLDYFIGKIGNILVPPSWRKACALPTSIHKKLGYLRYVLILPFFYLAFAGAEAFGGRFAYYTVQWYFIVKILTILIVPLLMPRFFCKYICFHRALGNIINRVLPLWSIKRSEETCLSCHKCIKACPMSIDIEHKNKIIGGDCIGCFECLDVKKGCPPRAGSLELHFLYWKVSPSVLSIIALIVYFGYYIYSVLL